MSEQQNWPEGVIARYLTVGGATVYLIHGNRTYPTNDGIGATRNHTTAVCTGCPAAEEFSHWKTVRGNYSSWETRDPDSADRDARDWAQAHAQTCRAMPRPAVTR
ncbi:hypothetical protein ACIPPM_22020 [Streptomyces sp. NPDC090119]|uniref:hypothetical protein n=1 Tax=Streptomyces sp. NPDC090119 TaxID=3365951 RepID=UPI0037F52D91